MECFDKEGNSSEVFYIARDGDEIGLWQKAMNNADVLIFIEEEYDECEPDLYCSYNNEERNETFWDKNEISDSSKKKDDKFINKRR